MDLVETYGERLVLEERKVFEKLQQVLTQTQAMRKKLNGVVTRFSRIQNKSPDQQEEFYRNVMILGDKLQQQENVIQEKISTYNQEPPVEEQSDIATSSSPEQNPCDLAMAHLEEGFAQNNVQTKNEKEVRNKIKKLQSEIQELKVSDNNYKRNKVLELDELKVFVEESVTEGHTM